MAQLCRAVKYLHTLKPEPIAHRDLKPDNCLVSDIVSSGGHVQSLTVKLCDFGTSRATGGSNSMQMMQARHRLMLIQFQLIIVTFT